MVAKGKEEEQSWEEFKHKALEHRLAEEAAVQRECVKFFGDLKAVMMEDIKENMLVVQEMDESGGFPSTQMLREKWSQPCQEFQRAIVLQLQSNASAMIAALETRFPDLVAEYDRLCQQLQVGVTICSLVSWLRSCVRCSVHL